MAEVFREPVATPLQRRLDDGQTPLGGNLLLTTLAVAVVAAPFSQDDWPNPVRARRAVQLEISQISPALWTIYYAATEWTAANVLRRYVQQPDVKQNTLALTTVSSGTFQNLVGRPFSLAGGHGLAGD